MKPTVVVGMSGGVDSSVTAYLLKKEGYNVIGLFMKNWEEKDANGVCRSAADYEDVVRVCEQLDIPHYAVNFVQEYWDNVFTHFLQELKKGHTPNPDILCNREIKFKVLLEKALSLGGDYLATGHYAQTDGKHLFKGTDPGKDQSYFLYTLQSHVLQKVLFPIGGMHKQELRRMAREAGIATAEKKDSTGICFIGKRDFKEFVGNYIQYRKGPFQRLDGSTVGLHDGVAHYTIGQRKGLGIGGAGEAWFVVGKNIETNVVYVEQGTVHPALFCDHLIADELTWVASEPHFPIRCRAKIRYRQADQDCRLEKLSDGKLMVHFDVPQRAVTIRQSIVFYEGEKCLGGGIIAQAGPSYHSQEKALPAAVLLPLSHREH